MSEIWKPVVGYEHLYTVSSHGRVKRIGKGHGAQVGRIKTLTPHKQGYLTTCLFNKAPRTFLIHRLVAETFIGPIPPGKEVNHKDGDKTNNHVGNLEIVSRRQNILHGVANDFIPITGSQNPAAKLTEDDVRQIKRRYVKGQYGYKRLAKEYGVCWEAIRNIIKGYVWQHVRIENE